MVLPNEILAALAFAAIPILLLALLIVFLARHFRPAASHHLPSTEAHFGEGTSLEILEERYARGELDTAEFEERRARLLQDGL